MIHFIFKNTVCKQKDGKDIYTLCDGLFHVSVLLILHVKLHLVFLWNTKDWKRSVFIPTPKKGNAREYSDYCTITLISHASKIILKTLQARLQLYMNQELPDVKAGFRKKTEEPEIKLPISVGSQKTKIGITKYFKSENWVKQIVLDVNRLHQISQRPAATAKSLQLCLTLCNPIPGILQARTLEWVAISFSNAWKWKVKVKSLSHVRLFATPWTAAHQAPLSIGFSRQEYWSGVPSPSPVKGLNKSKNTNYPPRKKILPAWWPRTEISVLFQPLNSNWNTGSSCDTNCQPFNWNCTISASCS